MQGVLPCACPPRPTIDRAAARFFCCAAKMSGLCPGVSPKSSTADLSKRGWELAKDGDPASALNCHHQATSRKDANVFTFFHRGQAELQLGRNAEAKASFERSLARNARPKLEPTAATEANFQLGKLHRDDNDLAAAEQHYKAAVKLAPEAPGAHVMLGVTLRDAGRTEEALAAYTVGLEIQPGIPAAQYNRAQCLFELGRRDEGLLGLQRAISFDGTFATAYYSLGDELSNRNRNEEAVHTFKTLATLEPDSPAPHYNLGKIYFTQRKLELAIASHKKALSYPEIPTVPHAYVHNDLGNSLSDATGRLSEVLHHYQRAADLMPSFAEALSNVGTGLKEVGRHAEAAERFKQAIKAKPTLCEAYKNLGSSYGEIDGRLPEAVRAFEGALVINPEFWPALYALMDTKQFLSDWRGREELLRTLTSHLQLIHAAQNVGKGPDERMHGGLAPFQTLVMPVSVETQLAVTHNRARKDVEMALALPLDPPLRWGGSHATEAASGGGGRGGQRSSGGQKSGCCGEQELRLGFISSDFGEHPVGHALLPWIRSLRARPRLSVLCFASDSRERGHDGEPLRRDLASACSSFVDLTELSDAEAARIISDFRPHVLINLIGHTAGSRHVITQWKPSPVQAMHYGYPATTALPAMGYAQVDRVAVPPPMRADFTEKLAYFPHSHFVAVHAARYPGVRARALPAQPFYIDPQGRLAPRRDRYALADDGEQVRRRDLGLGPKGARDDSFALCNFNQLYKMEPETFQVWSNALRRVPSAFLWLTRVTVRKDTSVFAQQNLLGEAAALGVLASRYAFMFKLPKEDFVTMRALADLMVDNRAYNAHTTGADTLYAGVPSVLTASRHLAGRASASFASALGESGMAVASLKEYEDLVYELANKPRRLHTLRRRLLETLEAGERAFTAGADVPPPRAASPTRAAAPFFDLGRLAMGQQRLASAMWEVHAAGNSPMHVIAAR